MAPLSVSSSRKAALTSIEASLLIPAPAGPGKKEECEKEQDSTISSHPGSTGASVLPPQNNPANVNNAQTSLLSQLRDPQLLEVNHEALCIFHCLICYSFLLILNFNE